MYFATIQACILLGTRTNGGRNLCLEPVQVKFRLSTSDPIAPSFDYNPICPNVLDVGLDGYNIPFLTPTSHSARREEIDEYLVAEKLTIPDRTQHDQLYPDQVPGLFDLATLASATGSQGAGSPAQDVVTASSVPTRSLVDHSTILVEYCFTSVASLYSCFDGKMNSFRTAVLQLWT
ncbi:uncharacterized protein A1O9_04778 [Exophiala aquamarina CBS 119918]|uniref:Uncharacterized protein n=1 Tax=Exophiala aquamarina CBS 119918 TaxID=1182545 RepID=A0A072PWG9_9EURO|nr:uncharacterized protein A1O9_04778 [Exophiala aquamarina CBS 119918]KEF59930.1 hypothetical protein A1O9_04778 [Exophiala aquamarina CBS 119918]